jgi:hypothetical protein
MRYNYFLVVFFIIGLIDACSMPKNKTMTTSIYPKLNFDSSVKELAAKDSNMESNNFFLNDTLFLKLFEHSKIYKNEAIEFLKEKGHNNQQLAICILSMQNLEISDYIDFAEAFTSLYEKGNIPEWLLFNLLCPNFFKNDVIVKNYRSPNVIQLLGRIKKNNTTSKELKQNVTEILSGQAWSELKNSE